MGETPPLTKRSYHRGREWNPERPVVRGKLVFGGRMIAHESDGIKGGPRGGR